MKSILICDNKLIRVFDQQEISCIKNEIKNDKFLYLEYICKLMSNYDLDEDNLVLIVN